MKKVIILLAIVILFISCKDEVVQKPNRLIEKEMMINIMYDLAVLEAVKYQNPASLDTFKINPNKYIYKKYKIDSLQFAKSNIYYASNYEEYLGIMDQLEARLTKKKAETTALMKAEVKKKKKKKSVKKLVSPTTKVKDSLEIK